MASKFALLLLLAVQCVTFANAQPCSVLFGASSLQSTAINSPCVTLNSGDSAKLSKSFDQTGTSISSIDLGNGVFSLGLAGFQLTLSNVTLLSSVIFPPSSQAAALNGPLPAAFDLRTGGAVQLRNAIVFTSNCSAITQWSNFITQSSSCSATSFFIPFFSYPQANLTNVTLTCNRSLILKQVVSCPPGCNGNSSSLPSSFVHNGAELSSNLPPLTSLSSPFVVNALANIDLTSQPPWTIAIGSNATLNGGGGWLNLAGNPSLATLATTPRTTLSLLNFVIFNECVQFDPTNPRLQPNQQLAIASTLPGVVYSNATKYQPPPFLGLYVQNSTIVVSQDEVQALTYWHVALLSPSAFLGSPSLSAMSLQIPVQSLSLQAPPTPTSLSVNVMSGPGLLYNNVFITSQPPQLQMVSPTQYICNSPNGTKLDPSLKAPINLYMLASSSDFAKALSSLTLYPGGSSSTSSLSSPYPPILLINGYVGLLVNPPTPYVITRTTLISGPVDSSSSGLGGAPADAAVLDLNSGQNVISVQTTLFLQRIMIVNPIILQLPSSGSSAVQRSALPLYAFSGDRTTGYFLQLSMATLQLSSEDFVQIYTIASKGVAWKSGSDLGTNLLVQGTDTFDVTSYNCSYVRLGLYSGWGLNASDFLIVPDNPSKACALIIPTTNNSPVVPLQGSSSSSPSPSSSSAVAIGVGVGVGVGVLLLVLAGAFFYVKYWRGDKSKRYGRAVNFASTSADPAEMEDSPGELMVNGRLVEGAAIAGGSDNASRASGSRAMGASSYANPYGAPSTVLTGGGSVNQGIDLWKQLYDASNLGMNEEGGFEGGKEGEDAANAFIAVAKASNYHAAIVEESIDTLAPGNRSEGGNVISAIGKHQERLLNHQGSSMSTAEGGNGSLTALSGDARPTGTSGDDGTSAAQLPLVSESSKSSVPTKAPKSSFDPHKAVASIAKELRENEANKLQLLEPIGQGGFGTVYRGRWRNLEVAVKTVLFSEQAGSGATGTGTGAKKKSAHPQQRAVLEAAVCTSVMHQNVVTTYHYDITPVSNVNSQVGLGGMTIDEGANTDWKLYLVQEYCNASLQDALRNKLLYKQDTKSPDMDLILSVLMDIARGMIYIHSKNIIHGDLTPGNVLLKQEPSSPIGVVGKITDFGLCTTIDPGATHISNVTNGTPYYVAPEVVANGMLEKNSDVYSFGVLMWELYRCMPPWVKTETGYTLNKRFRRFPVDTPRIYVALCARCLDSNPKHRPPFPIVLAEVESMHNAYLMGYDNLEEPPPSFVDLSEDAARGSAASGRNSPRLRTNSNQILPPSPKDKEDQASNGDAIKIPLPPSQEQLRRGVDEEVEVVAGEAGVVSTTKTSERVGQEPTLRSIVSINAQGRLTVEGGGDKGVMSQGVNPPPRSQAFVQYFTSKQIRELKKTKGSEEGGSSPSHHD